MKSLRNW